jgi:hypothetical protein
MDFFPHAIAERGIYQLMPLNQTLAGESIGYDHRIEMLTVSFDLKMRAVETGSDIAFNKFWCGQHDFCLSEYFDESESGASVDQSMTQFVAAL